jgi:hypothetical protein
MKSLESLKEKHGTVHAAAVTHKVNPVQFARLIGNGAIYDEYSGQVYIPSKTKLTFKEHSDANDTN